MMHHHAQSPRPHLGLPGETPHLFFAWQHAASVVGWHNMLHLFVPATTATRCISFCLPPQEDPSAGRKVPPPYSIKTEQAFTTTGVCWFVVWPYFPV